MTTAARRYSSFCYMNIAWVLMMLGLTPLAAAEALRFSVPEGQVLNEFFREGPVAAHVVLTGGAAARVVIAFPAGNSGVALWFEAASPSFAWDPKVAMAPAERDLGHGAMHGVTVDLVARGAPIRIRGAVLGSVRVIRDFELTGQAPPEVLAEPVVNGNTVVWQRRRLDGAAGYHLSIDPLDGALVNESGALSIEPGADGRLSLRLTALTGDPPLTPLSVDELLTAKAAPDSRLRQILAFLSYEEKLLAGSWRFNTYFGRDTLMSLALLMPVLEPRAVEAGLRAVLERLNHGGEVAHEEDIGDFAALRRLQQGEPPTVAPIFDYKMIDDDFMLPLIAARYLLDTPAGRDRGADFLARRTASGTTYGAALVRNFQHVIRAAKPFASDPEWPKLIAVKPGEYAGNWRDSREGLGGGRFPYDVNGVLVPAALTAIGRLHSSDLLQAHLDRQTGPPGLANAAEMANAWLRHAPGLFEVAIDPGTARGEIERYARAVGVDPTPALASLGRALSFRAVALDGDGRPVPILNSDEAYALLFLKLSPNEAERIAVTLTRPFPAGLLTDVGMLVSNPAYARAGLEPLFDRSRYHGTVVWSWHQALLAAGLDRQLSRTDLGDAARTALIRARSKLETVIVAAHDVRASELWSWSQTAGAYRAEAFGQRQGDDSESNAAQLWSTVHLARPH